MKTNIKTLVIIGLVFIASLSSCQKELLNSGNTNYASILDVSTDGTSTVLNQNLQSAYVETADLTDTELASLQKMKEEEKLARDVYTALSQKWGSTVFSRISQAENNHLGSIIQMLKYYGDADTLEGEAGIFANENTQELYNEMVSNGSLSLVDGYKTGVLIEEMDIKDLSDALSGNPNSNITMLFENLQRGSRNHLRSFYKQLTTLETGYTPTYLTSAEFNQIVTSSMEKGLQYKMKGSGNGTCDGSGQSKRYGRN